MTSPSRPDAAGSEILLLERDEGLREPLRIWLSERWNVHVAADAADAREDFSPSLAVVVMSDTLLLETPEKLLETFADRGYTNPVVVLASRMDRPAADGLDIHYLSKPVTRDALLETVADLTE